MPFVFIVVGYSTPLAQVFARFHRGNYAIFFMKKHTPRLHKLALTLTLCKLLITRVIFSHMIIACPSCQTRYNVNIDQLGGAGRVVKCVRCGHKWHQEAPAREQVENQKEATPTTPPRPEHSPKVYRSSAAQKASDTHNDAHLPAVVETAFKKPLIQVSLAIILIVISMGAFYTFRTPLSQLSQNIKVALNPFGSQENLIDNSQQQALAGLVIGDINRQIEDQDGFVTYILKGRITNTSTTEKAIPNLRVTLYGENGEELDAWRVQPNKRALKPGEDTGWVCLFYNPDLSQVTSFEVAFISD